MMAARGLAATRHGAKGRRNGREIFPIRERRSLLLFALSALVRTVEKLPLGFGGTALFPAGVGHWCHGA